MIRNWRWSAEDLWSVNPIRLSGFAWGRGYSAASCQNHLEVVLDYCGRRSQFELLTLRDEKECLSLRYKKLNRNCLTVKESPAQTLILRSKPVLVNI